MDGIITPEQLQALEAQAVQEQANLSQASIRPSLERDAALVAEYARKSAQQVRQPSSISEFFFKGPVVPIEERLGYAREAARLQGDIQRRIQEAGLMQGPVQQTQAEQVAPKSSPEQHKSETPAQPSANATAPTQEQKQPDQFSEFSRFIKQREEARAKAVNYIKSNFSREYWLDGLELANKMTDEYFAPPRNIAQPIIDQFTGKPLEGYALIGGKVEKIEKPKVEEDGRSVIGYEGKAPTQAEAVKFRSDAAETSEGVRALDELIQIGRKGSSLSPTDRARAQNLARMIQGRLREDIVGPGAVSNPDREVLEQVISNPLQIFTLVDIPLLLEDMKARVISGQNTKAAILGLKPIGQQQQQQSAPGGVVKAVRMPGGSLTRQ